MKWSIKYIVSALPFLFTACSGDWLDLDPADVYLRTICST